MSRSPTLMNQCYWSQEMCFVSQLVWHVSEPPLLNEHKRLIKVRISIVFHRFLLSRLCTRERERERESGLIPILKKWRIPCFVFLRLPLSRRCTTMWFSTHQGLSAGKLIFASLQRYLCEKFFLVYYIIALGPRKHYNLFYTPFFYKCYIFR